MNCKVYLTCDGKSARADWYYLSIEPVSFIAAQNVEWKVNHMPKYAAPCCDGCKAEIEKRVREARG